MACALTGSSVLLITTLNTTANDPLAIVPLLWALALMAAPRTTDKTAAVAAALWGLSAAFKLSNVLALPLLLFWWWTADRPHLRLRRGAMMAMAATVGFVVAYAPWGWQLWAVTGSPFHPLIPGSFGR